jgi:FAD-dependent urate hydroxylase
MSCDVMIVGAGPYGLSAACHLSKIRGLEVRIFGDPMSFWRSNMPVGMFLRSNWTATQIIDPDRALTLEAFQAAAGKSFSLPVPLDRFVEYGEWFQRQGVPGLEQKKVTRIERVPDGFRATLEDGESVHSRRVIVAVGINSFAWRPPEFAALPPALVSHASQHSDLNGFTGKQVLVIGSGQSALESAALLHEGGAQVEVIGRATQIHWLQGWLSKTLHHGLGQAVRGILYAPTDVGPAGLSQLLARPDLLKVLPRGLKDKLRKRAVRPAGARWLVDRLTNVPIRLGRLVASATAVGERVKVKLDDGTERVVDHVLLGTGYRVDVSKYEFLSRDLVQSIDRVNGYPRLRPGLETSVAGLHILGSPAAWTFGPLMQFVSGTGYASKALLSRISKSTRPGA